MTMGAPTPSVSKQDYGTPRNFLDAVELRFGPISIDLAASRVNAVVPHFFTADDNSLSVEWAELGECLLWLNPPFKQCAKFAEKCAKEASRGAHILFLAPASVGCNWFWSHCARFNVMALSPRLVFDGTPLDPKTGKAQPFMKDLMLVEFNANPKQEFNRWRWRP